MRGLILIRLVKLQPPDSLCNEFLVKMQARRQEFPEGGSSTRVASRAKRGALTTGGLGAAQEALGYLEQNSEI